MVDKKRLSFINQLFSHFLNAYLLLSYLLTYGSTYERTINRLSYGLREEGIEEGIVNGVGVSHARLRDIGIAELVTFTSQLLSFGFGFDFELVCVGETGFDKLDWIYCAKGFDQGVGDLS